MSWTVRGIKRAFSGRLVGHSVMKRAVCETVLLLPPKMIKHVTGNVWFISSPEDAWAFTFRGSDIAGQHLIVLTDDLFKEAKNQIRYTILHEIGHVMLGRRNSMGFKQSPGEVKKQEQEADQFAKGYLQS